MSPEDVVDRISTERKQKGISQEEAAHKAGVSQPYWCMVESGRRPVSGLQQLRKLAAAVGLRLDVMLRRPRNG